MTIKATMHEAKTRLSELVRQAQAGEEVIITSGREKKPVVRLTAVEPETPLTPGKRLGVMVTPGFVFPDSFWEPLSDEEMGYGEDKFFK